MALDVHSQLTTRRVLSLIVLVAAAGAITASEPVHAAVRPLVAWAQSLIGRNPTTGAIVFVALSALSAMFAFLSTSLLAPVAVVAWGKGVTFVLLWTGWLIGGTMTYGIGRFLGRSAAATLAGPETLAAAETFVRDRTHVLHVLLFQLALPSEILGYVLGVLRYRFSYYMGVLVISEIPFALAVVYLGASFLEGHATTFVVIGLSMVTMSVVLFAVMSRVTARTPTQ